MPVVGVKFTHNRVQLQGESQNHKVWNHRKLENQRTREPENQKTREPENQRTREPENQRTREPEN